MQTDNVTTKSNLDIAEKEWHEQWTIMSGDEYQTEELFWQWVSPLIPESFQGKRVLDGGCGGGHMLSYIEPYVAEAVGVDLNTSSIASERFRESTKVKIVNGDICNWQEESGFDVVYSVGVAHHTENPEVAVKNLLGLVKPGGLLAFWVYGYEGNALVRIFIEKPKKFLFSWMPRTWLWNFSKVMTFLINIIVYTIYQLPWKSMVYYDYFQNWKKLSFERNVANVFDKLNAPRTYFIRKEEIETWFQGEVIEDLKITPWCGISWRVLIKK